MQTIMNTTSPYCITTHRCRCSDSDDYELVLDIKCHMVRPTLQDGKGNDFLIEAHDFTVKSSHAITSQACHLIGMWRGGHNSRRRLFTIGKRFKLWNF